MDNIVEKGTPNELLRSGMAQFSKWVEGEKHVTITINIQNNFGGILKIYTIIWWNEKNKYFELRSKIKNIPEVGKNAKIQKCNNVIIKILAFYFVVRPTIAIFASINDIYSKNDICSKNDIYSKMISVQTSSNLVKPREDKVDHILHHSPSLQLYRGL